MVEAEVVKKLQARVSLLENELEECKSRLRWYRTGEQVREGMTLKAFQSAIGLRTILAKLINGDRTKQLMDDAKRLYASEAWIETAPLSKGGYDMKQRHL